MKYNLQTWNLLVYVARLWKKNIILWRTLAKIVEKIKVTKLKYLITAWLNSNNPLQRKHARRKLVFTVAVLLKGNRSSFSKQLGINCTCKQIELFLISTRGCGSHSWKLLKSPICSRVQLIPNCFSNRPISYTNMQIQSKQILLKQLDFCSRFLWGDSWFGRQPHQLLPHRNLELII